MEIIKCHYKISKPVNSYREIKKEAEELIRFIHTGPFNGNWNKPFAIAHCQVSETPMAFFVVSKDVLAEKMFEHFVIINPKIIEAPAEKDIGADSTMNTINEIEYQEPCMSFPFRTTKMVKRYDLIKVRYQIPKWYGLKTIERQLTGIASEIFQHEYDHMQGRNIYFETETPVKWWELIGKERSKAGTSLEPAEGLGLERAKENITNTSKTKDYAKKD